MYDELLIALDGTDAGAVPVVGALARHLGIAVSAVIVDEPNIVTFADDVWLEEHVQPEGVTVRRRFIVTADDAADALVALAAESPRTLLCLGSHGRSDLGELLLGSVSAEVVRRSPKAVLVVGKACRPPTTFDVVAVVPGPGAEHAGLVAGLWADALGARVLFLDDPDELDPDAALTVMAAHPAALPGHPLGDMGAVVRRARQPVVVLGPSVSFHPTEVPDEGM